MGAVAAVIAAPAAALLRRDPAPGSVRDWLARVPEPLTTTGIPTLIPKLDIGQQLIIIGGKGCGQVRTVVGPHGQISPDWTELPDATSRFVVCDLADWQPRPTAADIVAVLPPNPPRGLL